MKCNAHVIKRPSKKKTSMTVKAQVSWWHVWLTDHNWGDHPYKPNQLGLEEGETIEVCDGNIAVKVRAVDEPDWGDHYARFYIEYECDKCGMTHFPELPRDEEEVSVLLTEIVSRMSDEDAEMLREIRRQEQIAADERSRKWQEEMDEQRAAERAKLNKKREDPRSTDGLQ